MVRFGDPGGTSVVKKTMDLEEATETKEQHAKRLQEIQKARDELVQEMDRLLVEEQEKRAKMSPSERRAAKEKAASTLQNQFRRWRASLQQEAVNKSKTSNNKPWRNEVPQSNFQKTSIEEGIVQKRETRCIQVPSLAKKKSHSNTKKKKNVKSSKNTVNSKAWSAISGQQPQIQELVLPKRGTQLKSKFSKSRDERAELAAIEWAENRQLAVKIANEARYLRSIGVDPEKPPPPFFGTKPSRPASARRPAQKSFMGLQLRRPVTAKKTMTNPSPNRRRARRGSQQIEILVYSTRDTDTAEEQDFDAEEENGTMTTVTPSRSYPSASDSQSVEETWECISCGFKNALSSSECLLCNKQAPTEDADYEDETFETE